MKQDFDAAALPQDFLKDMQSLLGDEYEQFIASYSREKKQALRINTLKSDIGTVESEFSLSPVPWCKESFYYEENERPGKSVLHEGGAFYIQEPSASAVVENLGVQPSEEIILDLCAAPGGKSTQIAAKMKGGGVLISNEIVPSRAKILSQNIERLGIVNCIVTCESPQRLSERYAGVFDRILVDAPCSGEGMFRKNPLAITEWSRENVKACKVRQLEILDCAVKLLKRGGRIVYSTCTFSKEENEEVIDEFLTKYKGFEVLPPEYAFSTGYPIEGSEHNAQLALTSRIFPHKHGGEGHFFAVLQEKGQSESAYYPEYKGKVDKKTLALYKAWERENLNSQFDANALFGQNLYCVPKGAPDFDRIKVERAGLCLGELKKDRFEPAHALAMALKPQEAKRVIELNKEQAAKYLAGEGAESDVKGWTLVAYKGVSLGWGKGDGSFVKNHYPKGLRKSI